MYHICTGRSYSRVMNAHSIPKSSTMIMASRVPVDESLDRAEPANAPSPAHPQTRNAFSELMSPKSKHTGSAAIPPASATSTMIASRRDPVKNGLGAYIASPDEYPPSRVIYHNSAFVVINDLYPKSSVHLLLLPRDPAKQFLHPFDAFEDVLFLNTVRVEASKLKILAANELQRLYGRFSARGKIREDVMLADPPPSELPLGRDYIKDIMIGIHAHPSMNHLHVHIISKDRMSASLRHRKHYNSFSTPFFVPLEDFPLSPDDPRRHPGREGYLRRDFECWRCGRNFGNKFAKLKDHLGQEFEKWKIE